MADNQTSVSMPWPLPGENMSFLSSLFLNKDNVSSVVKAGISAGDKLFYTSEEKADDNLKLKEWYLNLLDSMKPFNIAMRLLAVGVFSMWALHLMASSLAYMLAFYVCDPAALTCAMTTAAEAINNQMTTHINPHFETIIYFYFGVAGLNSAISNFKGKDKQ